MYHHSAGVWFCLDNIVPQPPSHTQVAHLQGLDDDLDLKRILKAIKKRYNCNGNIKKVKDFGEIIQVQGDQRGNIKEFLLGEEIYASEDRLVLHGF